MFIPTGVTLDPDSRLGAAILRTAAHRRVDPYHLAVAVEHVWQETRALYAETIDARRKARVRTGTHSGADRPLGDTPDTTPQAGPAWTRWLRPWSRNSRSSASAAMGPDYAEALWELLRTRGPLPAAV